MPRRVVVLGGGVTGEAFIAALRRRDREAEITLVERELVGGECSYWACIPSKTLLRPLEIVARARIAPGAAEAINGPVDVERVFAWRDEVAGKDDTSQADWVRSQGAELVRGSGRVVEPGRMEVDGRELVYDALLIATGSVPTAPPVEGLEEAGYWTSREGTSASEAPASLVVVGGGAVGCELAQFYARLGARVTLVQSGDHLLPRVDREAGDLLAGIFAEEGIDVRLGTQARRVEGGGRSGYRIELTDGGAVEAAHLLVATGRRPNVDGFGFEELGLEIERGGIVVDDGLAAAEGVWAAGDVTGVALFTHVGKYQARVAAANVAGGDARADYRAIPAAIFTDPQVASVGDTSGDGAVVASWRTDAVSRAATYHRPKRPGFVKLFADPERRVLVGGIAVAPEAGEWLGQLTLAVRAEVPVDVLRDTIQPFPTFSEAIFFAARELDL
jgi:pyruvate/2-oxoglutarate dehydrogenase complex dihydrolipoamide dehydrogenase (E3) component